MGRNGSRFQKTVAEQIAALQRESVSYERANGIGKRQKTRRKISMTRAKAIKIQCEEMNKNCAVRGNCADFFD